MSNGIPVAKCIVNCTEKDLKSFLEKEKETIDIWKRFGENVLVISDYLHIWQCAEEYPLVTYKCDQKISAIMLFGNYLNSFVKRISVSIVKDCKKFTLGVGEVIEEGIDSELVIYYEDNFGECHMICQEELCKFLKNIPKLVVSPEGVLVFYTSKEILATIDCNHYIYVRIKMEEDEVINDIIVCDGYSEVILQNNVTHEQRSSILKFDFSFAYKVPLYAKIKNFKKRLNSTTT